MLDTICYIEYGAIIPIVYILSMIVMLWLISKYIKSMKAEQDKALRLLGMMLFCTQMTFCMVNALNHIIWAFGYHCVEGSAFIGIGNAVVSILYYTQYAVLLLLLFYRLKVVFDATAYQLSQCTLWVFSIMYILFILLALSLLFLVDWSEARDASLYEKVSGPLCALLGLSIISFLTILFVKKLIDVNKQCDCGAHQENEDNELLSAITKQSILTLVSVASLLAYLAIVIVHGVTGFINSSHGYFLWYSGRLIDVWSNFICIFLSFASFSDYYTKMCGCCDTRCKQLCHRLTKILSKEELGLANSDSMKGHPVESTSV